MIIGITLSPGVTDEQRKVLQDSLNVGALMQQMAAVDSLIVGTVILGISFITKSFFDEFFKQAGKDTYEWLKIKLGLIKAKERGELKTEYHICIHNVVIKDDPNIDIEKRHDSIIKTIKLTWEQLPPQDMKVLKCVKLKYNEIIHCYTEAELYDDNFEYEDLENPPKPFRTIELPKS